MCKYKISTVDFAGTEGDNEVYSDLESELVDGLLVDTVIEVGTLIYGT